MSAYMGKKKGGGEVYRGGSKVGEITDLEGVQL